MAGCTAANYTIVIPYNQLETQLSVEDVVVLKEGRSKVFVLSNGSVTAFHIVDPNSTLVVDQASTDKISASLLLMKPQFLKDEDKRVREIGVIGSSLYIRYGRGKCQQFNLDYDRLTYITTLEKIASISGGLRAFDNKYMYDLTSNTLVPTLGDPSLDTETGTNGGGCITYDSKLYKLNGGNAPQLLRENVEGGGEFNVGGQSKVFQGLVMAEGSQGTEYPLESPIPSPLDCSFVQADFPAAQDLWMKQHIHLNRVWWYGKGKLGHFVDMGCVHLFKTYGGLSSGTPTPFDNMDETANPIATTRYYVEGGEIHFISGTASSPAKLAEGVTKYDVTKRIFEHNAAAEFIYGEVAKYYTENSFYGMNIGIKENPYVEFQSWLEIVPPAQG